MMKKGFKMIKIMCLAVAMLIVMAPTQKVQAETTDFYINWTGSASPSASATVSKDNFNSTLLQIVKAIGSHKKSTVLLLIIYQS